MVYFILYLRAIDLNRNGEWEFTLKLLNGLGELGSFRRAFSIV